MSPALSNLLRCGLAGALLGGAMTAQAGIEKLNDNDLAEVSGQAFISLNHSASSDGQINYTRLNFGGQIETQLNTTSLKLGEYSRIRTGTTTYAQGADLNLGNFALGTVDDASGRISPFVIRDPYLEFAYKGNRIIGMRVGFGQAYGALSADILSFSGNIDFRMQGTGAELKAAACQSSFLACIGTLFLVNSFKNYAIDGTTVSRSYNTGNIERIRAEWVGAPNGARVSELAANGALVGTPLSLFSVDNCKLVDLTVCFPISTFKTLQLGSAAQPAKDVFFSVQSEDTTWKNANNTAVAALQGAFMNIPKTVNASGISVPAIIINFLEKNGIPRANTCFGNPTQGC